MLQVIPLMGQRCVTLLLDRVRDFTRFHASLPEYQQVIEREGVEHAADMAFIGDENAIRAGIERLRDAGATEFGAALFGDREEQLRTIRVLGGVATTLR